MLSYEDDTCSPVSCSKSKARQSAWPTRPAGSGFLQIPEVVGDLQIDIGSGQSCRSQILFKPQGGDMITSPSDYKPMVMETRVGGTIDLQSWTTEPDERLGGGYRSYNIRFWLHGTHYIRYSFRSLRSLNGDTVNVPLSNESDDLLDAPVVGDTSSSQCPG